MGSIEPAAGQCSSPPATRRGVAWRPRSRSTCCAARRRSRSCSGGSAWRPGRPRRWPRRSGDLPLALEQAAVSLEETGTPAADYLDLLRDRGPELFALGRSITSEQTIATIWTLSLDRIRVQAPVAQDLLALCAFLTPTTCHDPCSSSTWTGCPSRWPRPCGIKSRSSWPWVCCAGTRWRRSPARP
jgi:hypothetical protein